MAEPILKVRNLVKIYNLEMENEFEALHKLNFDVEEGELICVMGPSGSGKSTFINTISTIDIPTSGSVVIGGKDTRKMSANELGRFRSKNLGFIFQEFNLLNTHTVFENIALPLSLAGKKKDEIENRVQELAKLMAIDHILKKYPKDCSGGQRQRTAICRALSNNPKLLIADEPTGNLDSKNTKEFLQIIKRLNEEENVTIIMVTHDPLAASYSSRLVYIRDGNIESVLSRGDLTQQEYFDQISELNASESREVLV